MTWLVDESPDLADRAIRGIVEANARLVREVDGGVVARELRPGQVAVVVGGGSGHYPAFAGWVGPGMAAGAACGDIFASPSAGRVHRVASAVESGAGVLFIFGNYAGDVLQFGQAALRLEAEGVETRTVAVTDDIASAGHDERRRRRGIAGGLIVVKVASAAAEQGWPLAEVERVAIAANDRTRTLGVAFSGCTLPGADAPLFEVPAGRMAVGLGIHGEPGLGEQPIGSTRQLVQYLVDRLLADSPAAGAGRRLALVVNSLGALAEEELFSVFGAAVDDLESRGFEVIDPACGSLITSLDMAGLSVTVTWLDSEIEKLWTAPSRSAALSRVGSPDRRRPAAATRGEATDSPAREASTRSRELAAVAAELFDVAAAEARASESDWGRLDAIAGDGDHGIGMRRGAVSAAHVARGSLARGVGIAEQLALAGESWNEAGGGTSGALWGIALTAAGADLADSVRFSRSDASRAVTAAVDAIRRLGGAQLGDKTMVDAAVPFAESLSAELTAGSELATAWVRAAQMATDAAAATAGMVPRLGRARPHATRSMGNPDAGAISFARVMTTVGAGLSRGMADQEGRE